MTTERRYNVWAGNPKGYPEVRSDCIEEVASSWGFHGFVQCSRKRGYGPDGLYCRQHAKKIEKRANQG